MLGIVTYRSDLWVTSLQTKPYSQGFSRYDDTFIVRSDVRVTSKLIVI